MSERAHHTVMDNWTHAVLSFAVRGLEAFVKRNFNVYLYVCIVLQMGLGYSVRRSSVFSSKKSMQ